MKASLLKFYNVDNGDMSLVSIGSGTNLLIDCNIRESSIDSDNTSIFDVKKDLISSLPVIANVIRLDVMILTHGDNDHCRGFKNHFYRGDPKKYSKEDKENKLILVDELWFSPMIAEEHTNDDEDAYQQEAERRLDLHRTKHAERNLPGNRIKIVGYDGNKDYQDLNHLRAIPGTVVNTFNEKSEKLFSIFVHAPFKEHLISEEKDKNSTSIVMQLRFKTRSQDPDFSCLAMFGGDSTHSSWKIIQDKTKKYGNDISEQALDWDLFLAPHHCSWSFFNDTPEEENPKPLASSLTILEYARPDAHVIASSKKILNNEDNPPHHSAKLQYVKKVGTAKFLNTAVEPSEKKPSPIIFEVTTTGPVRKDESTRAEVLRTAAQKIREGSLGTSSAGTIALTSLPGVQPHQPHRFYGNGK